MNTSSKHVVVALRMAGIAGQDKLNGIFEHLSQGHRWQMTLYRTQHEFTAETVRRDLENGVDGFIVAIPDADEAMAVLVEDGYDPAYGARPVKRALQRDLETPVARSIIAGKYPPGSTVRITAENGVLKERELES